MAAAVEKHFERAEIVIKSAAVADYRPTKTADQKIKKKDDSPAVSFERTADILAELGRKKGDRILVGFAAETQDLIPNAREKLQKKNLDMIVANDVSRNDIGFGSDKNKVSIIVSGGEVFDLPKMTKEAVAHAVLDRIAMLKKETG